MERFLIVFSKRGVALLALLAAGGLVFGLHLDERIGVFLMGILFALAGAGQLAATRKDMGYANCLRYFIYALSASVLLFGVFISMVALLMILAGVPMDVSGR